MILDAMARPGSRNLDNLINNYKTDHLCIEI